MGALAQALVSWSVLCVLLGPPSFSESRLRLDLRCVPEPGLSPGCCGEQGVCGSGRRGAYCRKVLRPLEEEGVRGCETTAEGSPGSASQAWHGHRSPPSPQLPPGCSGAEHVPGVRTQVP